VYVVVGCSLAGLNGEDFGEAVFFGGFVENVELDTYTILGSVNMSIL
jgi:hypothetical protein